MKFRTTYHYRPGYECEIVSRPLVCATHQAIAVRSIQTPEKVITIGDYPMKTKGVAP